MACCPPVTFAICIVLAIFSAIQLAILIKRFFTKIIKHVQHKTQSTDEPEKVLADETIENTTTAEITPEPQENKTVDNQEHKKQHAAIWQRIEAAETGEKALTEGGLLFLREHIMNEWVSGTSQEIEIEALRNEDVRREFLSIIEYEKEKVKERLEAAYRTGTIKKFDYESLAIVLVALVDGLSTQYHLHERKMDYDKIWRVFSEAILKGLLINGA